MTDRPGSDLPNEGDWTDLETILCQAAEYIEPRDELRPRILEDARQRQALERTLGGFLSVALVTSLLMTVLVGHAVAPDARVDFTKSLLASAPLSAMELPWLTDQDLFRAWSAEQPGDRPGDEFWRPAEIQTHVRGEQGRILRDAIQGGMDFFPAREVSRQTLNSHQNHPPGNHSEVR